MAYRGFELYNLYAIDFHHETIRIMISMVVSLDLIFEGADISNAYFHVNMGQPVKMELPTDSTFIL